MIKYLLITIGLILAGCGRAKEEVILSVPRDSAGIKAEIVVVRYNWRLFADECFLQIVDSSGMPQFRSEVDLHEGHGGYESGVMKMRWISGDTLLIERMIADAPANLLYTVSQKKFIAIGDSLTTWQ